MKLKKMVIAGFKSFADRTGIDFPRGICAIVGPNGCGKSNVVDALKWAMGEQSVKQLRGKAMEDVIFAGTNGKPPQNMAEVSLTLANDNGTFPEELRDFTEVQFTRRLYRSGESAYLLNKRPCRLKDIHNIFMGSGMGARSYAIIQQGNIGAITEAGPEERRFFIEEAAGVTRYKNRKNEAVRKIEYTRQNLLRLNDIILEVARQMSGLKREASRAKLYNKLQEKIKRLDIQLAFHYYDDHTKSIRETEKLLRALKDADFEHVSKLKKLDAAVEGIKLERSRKSEEISDTKSKKFEMQRNSDRAENELAHLRQEIDRLGTEITVLEDARGELGEKNKNVLSEISQEEEQNAILKKDLETVNASLERELAGTRGSKDKLAESNRVLESMKSEMMDLVAREAGYKNTVQNAQNNKESLKRRLKRIDEEEAAAARKVAECGNAVKLADEELVVLKKEKEEFSKLIEGLRHSLDQKNAELVGQVKEVQTLDLDRSKIRSEYTALKKMEENFEWYRDGVKAIMKRGKPDGDSEPAEPDSEGRVIGLMADILRPEPSYEAAVEAVLGESLQYILVRDRQTGLESIDYLRTTGEGRSGFVPVSDMSPYYIKEEHRPHEGGDLLLNHVAVDSEFEHIAESLLGGVLVADTLDNAIFALGENGFQAAVTRDGDLVTNRGVMVGGSKEKLSGILAKKQELAQLETRMADLDRHLQAGRDRQKSFEAEARVLETDLQKQIARKNEVARDEVEAEKTQYKTTEDLNHARRALETIRFEQEQLADEESGIDAEMERHERALAEIGKEVEKRQRAVAELTGQIGELSAEMAKYEQRVVDLKVDRTSFQAKLENNENVLRRLLEYKKDGVVRFEQLSRDIAVKSERKALSEQKTGNHERNIHTFQEEIVRLDKELEANEAGFHEIDTKLRAADDSISDIRTQREETNSKMRVLELDQSQRHIKRDNIANRILEQYHQPIEDLRPEFRVPDDSEISPEELEQTLAEHRKKVTKLENVNLGAIKAFEEQNSRHEFLCKQREDLEKAIDDLHKVIRKINRITQERFLATFEKINEKLEEVFPRLFDGGTAKLILTVPDKPLETGVEFMVHPPGKNLTRLSLLSGGEKALSAIAFVFSIFLIKPASFCIMDEIDAPLDEANVFRFNELLKIIGEKSQIIMITHKKRSMEFADTLFGVTMEKKGVSKIVSVDLDGKEENKNGVQLV